MEWIEKIGAKQNLRYERKFTATAAHRSEILWAIKRHPAFFREIYHPRQINNIYLDTPLLAFYEANKIGISERKKIRIRWYGDLLGPVQKPTLEFKIKHGLVGDKWSWRMADFVLDKNFDLNYLKSIYTASNLPDAVHEELTNVTPTLLNCYQRTYFLSADGQYRLTLDEKLEYHHIAATQNTFLQHFRTPNQFIVELKYATDKDHHVDAIAGRFPFRMDKSSKYVNGIDGVRGALLI